MSIERVTFKMEALTAQFEADSLARFSGQINPATYLYVALPNEANQNSQDLNIARKRDAGEPGYLWKVTDISRGWHQTQDRTV